VEDTGDEDCDDLNPYSNAQGIEFLDGQDNDCDGQVDENLDTLDGDGDGQSEGQGDCDDTNPAILDGAPEICDGFDNDCDGTLLDEAGDMDGDGPSVCEGDCDDEESSVFPLAPELCWDLQDNDCDTVVDCAQPSCQVGPGTNQAPVANAGADVVVTGSATCTSDPYGGVTCPTCTAPAATLDGSGSSDPDGNLSSFSWTTGSPPPGLTWTDANLADPTLSGVTLTSAGAGTQSVTATISLTVQDCGGLSSQDSVTVTFQCTFSL
jgi:hypothetical protein